MSKKTIGQRIVEKWKKTLLGVVGPRQYETLANQIDAELAKIADIAEIAKYLNSPDRTKQTLDLRQILQWDLASNGVSEDGIIRREKFWPVSKVVEAIRQQAPDIEVIT